MESRFQVFPGLEERFSEEFLKAASPDYAVMSVSRSQYTDNGKDGKPGRIDRTKRLKA